MFRKEIIAPLLCFSLFLLGHAADETIEVSCTVNIKKPVHCVSEKFLSISVDPAVLLAGVSLSENSLRLAKHLGPAFIRIAGPTTQFIKYVDLEDGSHNLLSDDGNSVIITPSIWFGINEYLKLGKLSPVFGINDGDTVKGLWNPKSTLPLFEISEQLNVSCYWQLGYDSSDKNETRYKEDLNILHYILAAYGGRNDTWKIIGSDVSGLPSDHVENIMMELNDITEAVMWEPNSMTGEQFPQKDLSFKILQHQSSKPRTKLWTTVPKSAEPITFSSALLWAKQIGSAAKTGYDVIFRQPRIHELYTTTPIYWCSLLHKKLMGCHVLETKSSIFKEDTNIFAHCTRKQNSFVRRGALTVMVVNDHPNKYTVKIKLGNSFPEKSMEVQTYILTSSSPNSTEIYLNGQLLTPETFHEKHPFDPKIRRTKSTSHVRLSLPPLSIGFFVLPGARVPACIENEKETQLLLEEIEEDQNMPLSEEVALQLGPRGSFSRHNLLEEITHNLKEEMKSDEQYYKNSLRPVVPKLDKNQDAKVETLEEKMDEKGRKHFIDRLKLADKHKKLFDLEKKRDNFKKFLLEKSKSVKLEPKTDQKSKKLELNSEEIEQLLKERAVARAAQKNIVFTDDELDALIGKASKSFKKSRNRRSLPVESIKKRDINFPLLEKYSRMNRNAYNHQEKHYQPVKRKSNTGNKKNIRETRAVNVNLVDLKARIAERKRFWDDKKDELLGNSLSVKESIKDKIRELKSNFRFRRDINMDLLNKNSKIKNRKNKSSLKSHDEIEATIRKSGQTSADVLDELDQGDVQPEEHFETKGEIYAELADSEDLEEEQFFNNANNAQKNKKHRLFDKKSKIDPFAIEHPAIDIVEPPRRKQKGKKKSNSGEKLQFLTSSEEFTDIEEDMPCIHEFFGQEYKQKKNGEKKGNLPEINEYYNLGKLKRETGPEAVVRNKRDTDITIIEISKYDDGMSPTDLQDLLVVSPVLEKPLINEIYDFEGKLLDDDLSKTIYKVEEENGYDRSTKEEHAEPNTDKNGDEHIIIPNQKTKNSDDTDTTVKETNGKPKNVRKRRSTEEEHPKIKKKEHKKATSIIKTSVKDHEDKKPIKKHKNHENLNDQMQSIREKLQERKDELDKMVQKQKQVEKDKKEQLKSKLHNKKKSHLISDKDDIKFEIDFPKLSSRFRAPKIHAVESSKRFQPNLVKRSIFGGKKGFGNYHPITSDLKLWKPSDIASLKRDLHVTKSKKMSPPNDYPIFKNIFNKPYNNLRKRRFIDTDVEFNENGIDTDINEINKETDIHKDFGYNDYKINKNKENANIQDTEFLKLKLPNKVEFEILNKEKDSEMEKNNEKNKLLNFKSSANYDIYNFKATPDIKSNANKKVDFTEKQDTFFKDDINKFLNEFGKYNLKDIDNYINLENTVVKQSKIHEAKNSENIHKTNEDNNNYAAISKDTKLKHTVSEKNKKKISRDNLEKFNFQQLSSSEIYPSAIFDESFDSPAIRDEKSISINTDGSLNSKDFIILNIKKNTAVDRDEKLTEDNDEYEGQEGINNMDAIFRDGSYRFKLPNSDELDLIKNNEEIEIKLLHHSENENVVTDTAKLKETEEFSDLDENIPEVTLRSLKPIDTVEKFFGNIKDFFNNIGKDLQGYLKQIGLN